MGPRAGASAAWHGEKLQGTGIPTALKEQNMLLLIGVLLIGMD